MTFVPLSERGDKCEKRRDTKKNSYISPVSGQKTQRYPKNNQEKIQQIFFCQDHKKMAKKGKEWLEFKGQNQMSAYNLLYNYKCNKTKSCTSAEFVSLRIMETKNSARKGRHFYIQILYRENHKKS